MAIIGSALGVQQTYTPEKISLFDCPEVKVKARFRGAELASEHVDVITHWLQKLTAELFEFESKMSRNSGSAVMLKKIGKYYFDDSNQDLSSRLSQQVGYRVIVKYIDSWQDPLKFKEVIGLVVEAQEDPDNLKSWAEKVLEE